MHRFFLTKRGALSAVALSLLCSSCSSNLYQTAPIKGYVRCNGKPATGGIIQFTPIDDPGKTGRPKSAPGRVSTGTVKEDGSFTVKLAAGGVDPIVEGALIGPHFVTFTLPKSTPWVMDPQDRSLPPEVQENIKADLAKLPVYKALECGAAITPDHVEVKPGTNVFEFNLSSAPATEPPPVRQRRNRRDGL